MRFLRKCCFLLEQISVKSIVCNFIFFCSCKMILALSFPEVDKKGFQAELSSKYYSLHLFLQFYFCLILKHDPEKLFTFFLLSVLLLVVVYFHIKLECNSLKGCTNVYRIFALKQIFQMHAILIYILG